MDFNMKSAAKTINKELGVKIMKRTLLAAVFSLMTIFITQEAQALIAGADIFGLDFRINNPGARANAMGGAFVGLADDATAAYSNPAGLTILTQPEVSVEFKGGNYTTRIVDQTGTNDYDNSISGLSFLSFAYPAKNTVVSVFRHQLLNSESDFSWYQLERVDQPYQRSDIKMSIDASTIGIGLGTKLSDRFSIGLAVGFAQLDYSSVEKSYNLTPGVPPEPLGPEGKEVTSSSDSEEHYILSLLWNITGNLNMGMVYRNGPEFQVNKRRWDYDPTAIGDEWTIRYDENAIFKVPDVYGLGFSYRFESNLTLAADANFVEYSDLTDEFLGDQYSNFNLEQMTDFGQDDEWEFRLGLEYIIDLPSTPLALRAGYYFRPDHRIYYTGDISLFGPGQYLQKGDDDHVGSFGLGFLVAPNIQMDLAASIGDLATEGFLSMVYRFE